MEYVQLSMDEYIQSKNDIKNNLGGIVKSFVRIGWQLTRIDRSGAYKNDGYSSIAEFAAAEYGMNRTGVSRFMTVYETYSADGDTPELKEQYREFKFSQLTELLQVQEADRQMFTPEVKREDIREFQRFEKENEADPARLLDWKDAKSPEEKLKATIQEFCRENKDILNAVYSSIMEPKDLAEMISPSGSRSYRKGTVYLMFYEETKGIMVKVFGETPVDITYRYFLDVVHSLFDEYDAGAHTWEKCFGVLPDEGTTAQKQEEPVEPKMPEHSGKNIGNVHEDISAEKVMEKPEIAPAQPEEQIPGQDSIEENELFAVYYYIREDDSGKLPDHYMATVVTTNYKYELDIENNNTIQATTEPAVPHYLGEIPIIEYLNNKLAIGDFELQIPLIDAYNALMSDRVTDKEQFIDAILAIYGTLLTDEDEPNTEDEDESIRKAKARLKKYKVLEMPDTAKAEYLTRTFDENGVEILKKAIEQDIHKFSHIPCMSDESFGGNVSGVAMEFKLLGMENITKIKTRYYKKGLRKRVRIFCNYLALHGISIDSSGITMTFTRALPKNLLEISQIVANLWGKVSRKTLLSQVPFVEDVDEELKALEAEEEENLKRQQEVFGLQDNTPPEQDPDDKEKVNE